jgi:hypothetical protein
MMTRRRTAALLAATLAALAVPPAAADGPSQAAVTSFVLSTDHGPREVDLVAAREGDSDTLLVRIDDCGPRGCLSEEFLLPLDAGQLVLDDKAAELEVVLAGRALRVTWALDEGGLHLSGSRVRSDGLGGQTTATSFAGRSASVQVDLDDRRCSAAGALGNGVSIATQDSSDPVSIGAGVLTCGE